MTENNTFYESGDCLTKVYTAAYQRERKDEWREMADIDHWTKIRDDIYKRINLLWHRGIRYVSIYEKEWFPGFEMFLKDLQAVGYHVYIGDRGCPPNSTVVMSRICVYLDPIPNMKEWDVQVDSLSDM